jgi:hypothetical protein
MDATDAAVPTLIPTTETLAMKESVHRDRVSRENVAEASEPDDAFCQPHQPQQKQQHQQQQQDPAAELDVEQLKLLLQQHHALGDSDADIPEDDRTLLDIFGEVTKEYLTQHVVRTY